jgi:hypothetical protein
MANRLDYFFRQRVNEAELDLGFAELELADNNLAGDLGFTGVLANAAVAQHAPVPDLTVDVSGPASILDQQGRRIFFSSLQNVSVAQDDNGVATAVAAAGNEKVVSVFVRFDRLLSDPRVDGNSQTVFFRRDESFKFAVVQGAEAAAGGAAPPVLRSDAILLADVIRRFGQAQVLNDDLSTARRQDAFALTGAPRSLRRGRTTEAISDLLGYYNAHVSGSNDRHAGGAIDYNGGVPWADGTTNPAATVEAQLDKIISDLAAPGGAAKLGAAATAGAPNELVVGSVKSQLDALLASVNAHVTKPAGAHAASAIAYAGGGAWKDGSPNPAATVEAQLDKLVADLAADAGAGRLGAGARGNWLDGAPNPAGASVLAALSKIITDLSAQAAGADGAGRIGAQAIGNLVAGSVRSQLTALDATSVRTNVANVFAATQTVNGADGDTNAALATAAAPVARKLLWDIAGAAGSYNYRLYAQRTHFELTVNARWDGAQWVKDTPAASTKLEMDNLELRINSDDAVTTPFADQWPSSIGIGVNGHGRQTLDGGGNWTSPGPTEAYVGWRGSSGPAGTSIGTGTTFRKMFPANPSSITIALLVSQNLLNPPVAIAVTASGTGVSAETQSPNNQTMLFARVIAT